MLKIKTIKGESPLPQRKKVAVYARVSMECEKLMHSLSAQVSYYSDLIQHTPNWEYAGVYVDAGITGTNAAKRPKFQQLLADCEAGKIDIVLTKSISRFARNTVDLLTAVRRLKELGIEVRFEKEQINSLSGDGEVMLSILAGFAEQESVSISNNIKWAIQKKFQNGDVHFHRNMLGYRWKGDQRVIIPEEAEIVRFIFNEYLEDKSYTAIARDLDDKGIKSLCGAKHFPVYSIKQILNNEEYTGCMIMQKSYTISPRHQKVNRGEIQKYKIDDHHDAIIDRETFDRVQEIMAWRAKKNAMKRHLESPFSKLIRCGKCGCVVKGHRMKTDRKNEDNWSVSWRCSKKNRNGGCDCTNSNDPELFAAATILGEGNIEEKLGNVETVWMYDDKFVFEMKNGRKFTWRRK